MKQNLMNVLLAAAALLVAGCGGMGPRATRTLSLSEPWQDYERIVVRSRNGGVRLRVGDGSAIRIDGRMYVRGLTAAEAEANLDRLAVVVESADDDPGTLLVELVVPESLRRNSPGAHFEIRLPQACSAEVDTSNGSIRADGLIGPLVLDTSNGSISVTDIEGDVRLHTSNGRVTARDIAGELTAETSNGSITVDDVSGKCVLTTSNGSVGAAGTLGDLDVQTSNASIRVDASPPPAGDVNLRTSNGPIYVTLPAEMTADLDLSTSNGHIRATFGDILLRVRHISNRRIHATMGGGGGRICAKTSNASITLGFR